MHNARTFSAWWKSGQPWIWLTAGAVSLCLVMVVGLIGLIAVRGMVYFWPADLVEFQHQRADGTEERLLGRLVEQSSVPASRLKDMGITLDAGVTSVQRWLVKTGNRDLSGEDFRWLMASQMGAPTRPVEAVAVERAEWGDFYGYIVSVSEAGQPVALTGEALWADIIQRLERKQGIAAEAAALEKGAIGQVNYRLEQLRRSERRADAARLAAIEAERTELQTHYNELVQQLNVLKTALSRDTLKMRTADGREVNLPMAQVIYLHRPNAMDLSTKLGFYLDHLGRFLSDDPREANTEGGIFPAIFGTVLMVLVMSVVVTPFGVIAAVYLREYARQGPFTQAIRIAVNNLAGVPSVVYGVFGLGFFVYFVGGNVDQWFFADALPAPTFGTPGVLWASLTLALLTVPVVIVATEEGLSRIPLAIREGSLALGATKAETLFRTVLPMATPAIMTGVILAVARAAGEVAPLMMVGVVKLAPSLPLDGNFPYLHLERKFMHLGFHIYDVGFQSPNVDAARPLVYATAFLLVVIIVTLNLAAIAIRNRLRDKYHANDN